MNGALALSRKVGESILIGDDIEVTVVEVERGKARIAIRAPREVAIWRKEIAPARTHEHPAPAVQLVDLGVCPQCDGADVKRPDPLSDSFRCGGCRAAWYGVRRLAA